MICLPRTGDQGTEMTESEARNAVRTVDIKHERVSDYRTEFVSGASVAGPLQDGFFRMTFFRDAIPPVTETFPIDPHNPDALDASRPSEMKIQIVREDVFTLLLTPEIAVRMGQDLIKRAGALAAKK